MPRPNIIIGIEQTADGRRTRLTIKNTLNQEAALAQTSVALDLEENGLEMVGVVALEAAADLLEKHRPEHAERVRRIRTALKSIQETPFPPQPPSQ